MRQPAKPFLCASPVYSFFPEKSLLVLECRILAVRSLRTAPMQQDLRRRGTGSTPSAKVLAEGVLLWNRFAGGEGVSPRPRP